MKKKDYLSACTYNLKIIKTIGDKFKLINDITFPYKCECNEVILESI